jgi:hypothetical protein
MLSRLKFELDQLIDEMLSHIPNKMWESKKTTFCDFEMGGGQFIKAVVDKLKLYGHSNKNIQSRVFGFSDNELYLAYVIGSDIIGTFDIYKEKKHSNMKFDVIVGNPPYQLQVGPNKTEPIWHKFVLKSFNHLTDGGYLSLIHPSGWRNVGGKFSDVQSILRKKEIIYLNLNSFDKGRETFGVQTDYDFYCLRNVENTNIETKIINIKNEVEYANLKEIKFIPGMNINFVNSLIASDNKETTNVLYSRSAYGTDKDNTSKDFCDTFKFPCVYTITKDNGINYWYSNQKNNGHFGDSKVIFTNGSASYPIIDKTGKYGLTQFAYAIVDEPKNLENIKKALENEDFIKNVMGFIGLGNKYNYKIISLLRKDFWKEFI